MKTRIEIHLLDAEIETLDKIAEQKTTLKPIIKTKRHELQKI